MARPAATSCLATLQLALEDLGWSTAEHWMRLQASYDLAQVRRERPPR